jgi:hypothetical protein
MFPIVVIDVDLLIYVAYVLFQGEGSVPGPFSSKEVDRK